MHPSDHDEAHSDENSDSVPTDPRAEVVATTDPAVESGRPDGMVPLNPDETIVAQTSQISRDAPIHVHVANVPIEHRGTDQAGDKNDGQQKHDEPGKRQTGDSRAKPGIAWMNLAMTAVVALACGVGGAWAFSRFESKNQDSSKNGSSKKDHSSESQGNTADKNDKPADPKDTGHPVPSKAEFDGLRQKVDGMAGQFATLQERFEQSAGLTNTTSRDIADLQVKMKDVTHSLEQVGDVPQRIQPIISQLDRMQQVVNQLTFQIDGREATKPVTTRPISDRKGTASAIQSVEPPIVAKPMIPGAQPLPEASLVAAFSFFWKGKYLEAENLLKDVRISEAGDARVWYLSALAHGLVTNQWEGETLRFLNDGADRESKNSPSKADVDAAFAALKPEQGKDWLAAYRERLVKH